MCIFDLIADLQKKAEQEGNIEIFLFQDDYGDDFILESIKVEEERLSDDFNSRPRRIVLS